MKEELLLLRKQLKMGHRISFAEAMLLQRAIDILLNKAGNSLAHSDFYPEQNCVTPEQDCNHPAHAPSRESFISLCNEFWNWSEMDMVCAEDRGYELKMEWDGKVFKHPVTQALWRMYQAASGNYPVIPDGYVMVPKEPTDEMLAAAKEWTGLTSTAEVVYIKMLAAAPQEVKGE
ncbi:hypothetical protein [Klebsiella pneumoniae]|uniref:hypothetical protein n=1 Tax=Klebsiella pneumoniae TaxID=573 RepID=UPI0030EBC98B